jgi:hypothetical protein
METPHRPEDRATADPDHHSATTTKGGVDSPRIETNLSNKTLAYASFVAFLAWVFSVYDYKLFWTLLPVIAGDLPGWASGSSWSP